MTQNLIIWYNWSPLHNCCKAKSISYHTNIEPLVLETALSAGTCFLKSHKSIAISWFHCSFLKSQLLEYHTSISQLQLHNDCISGWHYATMAIANQIFVFHAMDFERRQDLQSQCAPWQDVSIGEELLEYFMLIVVMGLSISISWFATDRLGHRFIPQ